MIADAALFALYSFLIVVIITVESIKMVNAISSGKSKPYVITSLIPPILIISVIVWAATQIIIGEQ